MPVNKDIVPFLNVCVYGFDKCVVDCDLLEVCFNLLELNAVVLLLCDPQQHYVKNGRLQVLRHTLVTEREVVCDLRIRLGLVEENLEVHLCSDFVCPLPERELQQLLRSRPLLLVLLPQLQLVETAHADYVEVLLRVPLVLIAVERF